MQNLVKAACIRLRLPCLRPKYHARKLDQNTARAYQLERDQKTNLQCSYSWISWRTGLLHWRILIRGQLKSPRLQCIWGLYNPMYRIALIAWCLLPIEPQSDAAPDGGGGGGGGQRVLNTRFGHVVAGNVPVAGNLSSSDQVSFTCLECNRKYKGNRRTRFRNRNRSHSF